MLQFIQGFQQETIPVGRHHHHIQVGLLPERFDKLLQRAQRIAAPQARAGPVRLETGLETVQAAGAAYTLLGPKDTQIKSTKPVISVGAVRTGSGKSQTTRHVCDVLQKMGRKVVAVRHPMPYGKLAGQAVQRFATYDDLDKHDCTIEEREEYEPHIDNGFVVYAGVDYEMIVREAEKEADVILWDGGNNDTPFYRPDLHITLVDPHRAGHELSYYPGETNLRISHLLIVNKVDTADPVKVEEVLENSVVLNYRGTRFRLRALNSWVNL